MSKQLTHKINTLKIKINHYSINDNHLVSNYERKIYKMNTPLETKKFLTRMSCIRVGQIKEFGSLTIT